MKNGPEPRAFLIGHDGCFQLSSSFSVFLFSSLASSSFSCSHSHAIDRDMTPLIEDMPSFRGAGTPLPPTESLNGRRRAS